MNKKYAIIENWDFPTVKDFTICYATKEILENDGFNWVGSGGDSGHNIEIHDSIEEVVEHCGFYLDLYNISDLSEDDQAYVNIKGVEQRLKSKKEIVDPKTGITVKI